MDKRAKAGSKRMKRKKEIEEWEKASCGAEACSGQTGAMGSPERLLRRHG